MKEDWKPWGDHPLIVFILLTTAVFAAYTGWAQLQASTAQSNSQYSIAPTPSQPSPTTSPSPDPSPKPSNNNLIPPKPSPTTDPKPPDPEPPKISNHNFLEGKWIVEERATSELENWKVITWEATNIKRDSNALSR